MSNIRANLWKLYAYKFISEFYLIVPALIPYYMAHGLSSTQVFTIQATYALSVLLLEVPSGYLADVAGRKTTLVLGAVAMPIGLAVYAFSGTFIMFVLAEFLVAVANSMRSGSDSALIYDTLLQLKDEARYKKFEGRAFFFTRIGTASSAVLGGLAALLSLHLPFYINIITCTLMFPMSIALVEPERPKLKAKNPLLDILKVAKFSFSHGELRRLILYGALVQSTSIIAIWGSFLYFRELGISIGLFGVLFALFQLAGAFGARQSQAIVKTVGLRKSLALPLLIGLIYFVLGSFRSLLVLPLIILSAFLWNILVPILLDLLNRRIDSEVRATVLSVSAMAGSLSYVILAPIFGRLVDALSLSSAFLVLGGYFLIYGLIALASILRHFREDSA
jgi:predicted MFS family arabinose efflux permease